MTASGWIFAATYSEAIEKWGSYMDTIWENGHWTLQSCEAEPHLYNQAGQILSWKWNFQVKWNGPRKS